MLYQLGYEIKSVRLGKALHGLATQRSRVWFPPRSSKLFSFTWVHNTRNEKCTYIVVTWSFHLQELPFNRNIRVHICMAHGLKEYRMVFRAGLRDPCTRYVARLSESIKILEPQVSVFLRFPKVEQHPKCMDHTILLGKPFGNCFIK
jgi:hypothetical protein